MIAGRDRHQPVEAAEQRWALVAAKQPTHLKQYRDQLLRITARDSLETAVSLLVALGEEWGRDRLYDGSLAVIARLVQVAPERAAALVASASDPRDRLAWLEGLGSWCELTPAATAIASELLDRDDPALTLAVARFATATSELGLLDRALCMLAADDPFELARSLAPGVFRLRSCGRRALAAAVRARCLVALDSVAVSTFELIASPGPALVPWPPDGNP